MQSTDIILHYTFEPGTSFVGTQLCLVYQGEASTSMLTAFAEGRGKEVSIRMKRAVDPLNMKDQLKIAANAINDIASVPVIDMKCNFQLEYTSTKVIKQTPVFWHMPRQSCFIYIVFEVTVTDKTLITWIWNVTTN